MTAEWVKQESGWYTHPDYGGICLERDGKWWWYPPLLYKGIPLPQKGQTRPRGFATLKEAIRAAKIIVI